jgi:hypothetical protein
MTTFEIIDLLDGYDYLREFRKKWRWLSKNPTKSENAYLRTIDGPIWGQLRNNCFLCQYVSDFLGLWDEDIYCIDYCPVVWVEGDSKPRSCDRNKKSPFYWWIKWRYYYNAMIDLDLEPDLEVLAEISRLALEIANLKTRTIPKEGPEREKNE